MHSVGSAIVEKAGISWRLGKCRVEQGHFEDYFYRSDDPTNSVKALNEDKNTQKTQ